jgi:FMN phosphatase YigB (HAD superfamily)
MPLRWVLFDWGETLMVEDGPADVPMALWPEVRATDGAVETLTDLSRRYRLGVATNASVSGLDMIERALARVSLAPFVSAIFCYRALGVRKSEPAFWDAVVARLGVERDEILMVGDDLVQDVRGPRASGIDAVWLDRGRGPRPAGLDVPTIERLDELPALIGRIRGSG